MEKANSMRPRSLDLATRTRTTEAQGYNHSIACMNLMYNSNTLKRTLSQSPQHAKKHSRASETAWPAPCSLSSMESRRTAKAKLSCSRNQKKGLPKTPQRERLKQQTGIPPRQIHSLACTQSPIKRLCEEPAPLN